MIEWWEKIKLLLEPEAVAIYDSLIQKIPPEEFQSIEIATNEAIQLSQAISLRTLAAK